jgi:hypothetical protein
MLDVVDAHSKAQYVKGRVSAVRKLLEAHPQSLEYDHDPSQDPVAQVRLCADIRYAALP